VSRKPSKLTAARIIKTSAICDAGRGSFTSNPTAYGRSFNSRAPAACASVGAKRAISPNTREKTSPRRSHSERPYSSIPSQVSAEYASIAAARLAGWSLASHAISIQMNVKNSATAGQTPSDSG
jgi:hypothetical protein